MRKLLAVILGLLLIVFSCTGCLAVDLEDTLETQIVEIPQSKKISTSVQLDAEVMRQIEQASENSMVRHNSKTGETEVIDFGASLGEYGMSTSGGSVAVQSDNSDRIIVGPDDRYEITNVNQYPYRTMTFLRVEYPDGYSAVGSGVMVGNRTVLTAGHVVNSASHGWADEITVYPGGINSRYDQIVTSDVACPTQWASTHAVEYDYGIINLEETMSVGYLNLTALSDSQLLWKDVSIYGFPGDMMQQGTMWGAEGSIRAVENLLFLHDVDTMGGSSGSPVLDENNTVIGVHGGWDNADHNRAVKVTNTVIAYVNNYL